MTHKFPTYTLSILRTKSDEGFKIVGDSSTWLVLFVSMYALDEVQEYLKIYS